MTAFRTSTLYFAFALTLPMSLRAQTTAAKPANPAAAPVPAAKPKKETQAQLQKEATVALDAATATALAQVPGGKVAGHELEREKGKLIYSFDLQVPGKKGTDEVNIDAKTGTVIEKVHESEADEAKEAAAEKKAAPKKGGGGN